MKFVPKPIKYKLDKAFGVSGSTTGIVVFIAGIGILWFSWIGVVLIIVGSFIGFTRTCSLVDTARKRVKEVTLYFGIYPSGKWINITPQMHFAVKRSTQSYTGAVRSQAKDFHYRDYRVVLLNSGRQIIATIAKSEDKTVAEEVKGFLIEDFLDTPLVRE